MANQIDLKTPLLAPLQSEIVPATTAPVIIRDFFKRNTGVRISTLFAEFKHRFCDKAEQPTAEVTYRSYSLLYNSPDGPIIAALGGENKVEGTLTAVFAFLQRQPKGEPGFLQTNGYANIFYVRDKEGTLCAVRTGWADDGWVLDAISVADPAAWNGEHHIFCPLCESSERNLASRSPQPQICHT
jgi:hypothetical protein